MKENYVSVLMGVYNAKDIIRNAVETIEEQSIKEIEFVICDDCSKDGTYEILQELKNQYNNIVLIRNESNMGLAHGLNRCFQISTGEYIARMDADDLCKPDRFEIQRQFLIDHKEYDLVGTNMIMVDEKNNEIYTHDSGEATKDCFPIKVPFSHPTVLMRRYVLEKLGGYKVEKYTRRCEDLELWYRFFAYGFKGYNIPDYLYIKAQGIDDYKKRKVKHGFEMFFIHLRGLRLIKAPFYKYLVAIKPVISALVPNRLMMFYHSIKFKKKEG